MKQHNIFNVCRLYSGLQIRIKTFRSLKKVRSDSMFDKKFKNHQTQFLIDSEIENKTNHIKSLV